MALGVFALDLLGTQIFHLLALDLVPSVDIGS
jgi:hypothetical protein